MGYPVLSNSVSLAHTDSPQGLPKYHLRCLSGSLGVFFGLYDLTTVLWTTVKSKSLVRTFVLCE